MRKPWFLTAFGALIVATALFAGPQDPNAAKPAPAEQIPDAPSATRPQFPAGTKPAPVPQQRPAGEAEPPAETPAPPAQVTTVPAGQATGSTPADTNRYDDYRIVVDTNFVTVPVTVRDADGKLVDGLLRKDFAIYEDGVPQPIKLFTSDPFPLSAALIVDIGMSDTAMKKVSETLPAINGAFSQFDEVGLYTYGSSVSTVSDFNAIGDSLTGALRRVRRAPGQTGGVPIVSGPMANNGPMINGRPLDPGAPQVHTPRKESRVMNDAILRAALDLSRRDKARRRIIFILSDGKEEGSTAAYSDVLKLLLSHEITVYSIGVDAAGIPLYERLSRMKAPGLGTGNILPKYVSATGGDFFSEFTKAAIERTYAQVTSVARNQYTLGYTTRATAAGNYRSIEVRVRRPNLRVFAKDGYYPLPPKRLAQ